jgi:NADH-quinone oxidoreductase subunit H
MITELYLPPFLYDIFKSAVATIIAIVFTLLNVIIFIYAERKVWARSMQRMGPTYVGKWGSLQLIADLIKLLSKEIIVPSKANRVAFLLLPILVAIVSLMIAIILPYDYVVFYTLQIFQPLTPSVSYLTKFVVSNSFTAGLFIIYVVLGLNPVLILLTGWVSNNKYTVVGGFRAAAQLLSFEIPLLVVIASVVVLTNSLNLYDIVNMQQKVWFVIVAPLAFILFLITTLAEGERTPFDIPDAESEIIAGWNTEYSAAPYALLLMGMYARAFFSATLIAILFFGGWLGPTLPGFLAPFSGPFWLMLKTYFFMILFIVIRAAFPRYRIDQLLSLNWTKLLPLSIVNLILVVIAKYIVLSLGLIS